MLSENTNRILFTPSKPSTSSRSQSLSPLEISQEIELNQALSLILDQEVIYWRQCSCAIWLKEEDADTHFFHNFMNGRCNRNLTDQVSNDGITYTGHRELDPNAITSFVSIRQGSFLLRLQLTSLSYKFHSSMIKSRWPALTWVPTN